MDRKELSSIVSIIRGTPARRSVVLGTTPCAKRMFFEHAGDVTEEVGAFENTDLSVNVGLGLRGTSAGGILSKDMNSYMGKLG